MESLNILNLRQSRFEWSKFSTVNLPNLHHLTLAGTNIDEISARRVFKHQPLESLEVSDTSLTDSAICFFAATDGLERLTLAGCTVTADVKACFADSKTLKSVYARNTGLGESNTLELLRNGCQIHY